MGCVAVAVSNKNESVLSPNQVDSRCARSSPGAHERTPKPPNPTHY
jgi:hypothetical protein